MRKINTVLTADIEQAVIQQKRDEEDARHTAASALLDGEGKDVNQAAVGRGHMSLRSVGGSVVGALRIGHKHPGGAGLDTAILRKAKELRQWVVQQPAGENKKDYAEEDGSQVRDHRAVLRQPTFDSAFR